MEFGDYFKELRLKSKVTLRQFCEVNGFDPGNISKIERGILPPPTSKEKLDHYATTLGIGPGDDEYLTFLDLARTSRVRAVVRDVTDSELLNMLPVLFRTVDNKDITPEKLDRIVNLIKEETKK